jgi:hypothetical protein
MSAPAAMTLPGSRVVLGWWRDLGGLAPRRLWFAHLLLHHVEVLVEVGGVSRPLAPLAEVLLGWLRHEGTAAPERLAKELSVEASLLREVLEDLAGRGLARQDPAGWQATGAEGQPVAVDEVACRLERQAFFFADGRVPLFLPLDPAATTTLTPPAGWRFDLAVLAECIAESPEWKARHGFPSGVLRLVPGGEDWRAVPVDRPAQALLALVEVAGGAVLGFPVRADGWVLGREPVLQRVDGAAVLAPLGAGPGAEDWRHAWQVWCQQRSLPGSEVEACRLEWVEHRLRVRAPARLIERLRSTRSDALKGEAWLLAGTGRVRPAAMIELVEG